MISDITIFLLTLSLVALVLIYLTKAEIIFGNADGNWLYPIGRIAIFAFGIGIVLLGYYFQNRQGLFTPLLSSLFYVSGSQIALWSIGLSSNYLANADLNPSFAETGKLFDKTIEPYGSKYEALGVSRASVIALSSHSRTLLVAIRRLILGLNSKEYEKEDTWREQQLNKLEKMIVREINHITSIVLQKQSFLLQFNEVKRFVYISNELRVAVLTRDTSDIERMQKNMEMLDDLIQELFQNVVYGTSRYRGRSEKKRDDYLF